jgi:reductive dehalogenase
MISTFLINKNTLDILLLCIGLLLSGALLYACFVSIIEKEFRAAKVSFILSIFLFAPFITIYLLDFQLKSITSIILLGLVALAGLILFLPIRPKLKGGIPVPKQKHDERDVMFSRNELVPETEKYDSYYSDKPEKKKLDDKFRGKAGLLSEKTTFFEAISYASAHANLQVIEALKPLVDGEVATKKHQVDAKTITNYIKTWSVKLGAHTVGVTELKDYHLYSHKGRRDLYGKEIHNQHPYAIALTIEMDNDLVKTAPKGPVVMESTQQYLGSGTIALQIAHFIRNLGYSARSHIDGNYEVICPLVARDAGLGELGRMGLLMTPKLGPRVRIAVITTDIPLVTSSKPDLSSAIDFCGICKKCADICPSRSISFDDREEVEGVLRWKINSESCFTYWCTAGTDCGRCMAVCPYSHPNNLLHNFIRWGIYNSYIFRRFALHMDDLFYGRKPASGKIPKWLRF